MQKIKYQVFISSTFVDLPEERQAVFQTLMKMNCIPAGMELFPAADEEQFEFIKKVIDDCDYYVVIIGGRYGSLTSEGISYTEKEYDYAVSKEIKVIALLHKKPDSIPVDKSEMDPKARKKLAAFRDRVSKGRLVDFWESAADLKGVTAVAMIDAMNRYPAIGWVRANQVATTESLTEANELLRENERLRTELAEVQGGPRLEGIAGLDEMVEVSGTYAPIKYHPPRLGEARRRPVEGKRTGWKVSLTWRDLFASMAPEVMATPHDDKVRQFLTRALFARYSKAGSSVTWPDEQFQTVKVHLIALRLVECTMAESKGGAQFLYWFLTKSGERLMLESRSIKSSTPIKTE